MNRRMVAVALSVAFLSYLRPAVAQVSPEDYSPIDLTRVFNMGFADPVANDGKDGWTDQGPTNDMAKFPVGKKDFGGVPFLIVDPASNGGKSCLVFRGKPRPKFLVETPPLSVRQKGAVLYFLGACAWGAAVNEEVLRLVVTYVDDARYGESAFVYGKDWGSWWAPSKPTLGQLAWQGNNTSAPVGLYSFGWVNPYPEKTIDTIRLVSANTGAVPVIVAVTLMKPSPEAAKVAAQLRQREESLESGSQKVTAAAVKVSFSQTGIPIPSQLFSVGNGDARHPAFMAPTRELFAQGKGKAFFRYQINRVEPSPAENVWDFSRLDAIVEGAVADGAEPMLCICAPPKWMYAPMSSYKEAMKQRKPVSIEAFADYCAEIVRHYNVRKKARIIWWEVGNEMELYDWSYNYYIKVYREAAKRMKAVDPSIKIGGPVTAGPNYGWARELLEAAPELVDFVSYHQYGYSEPFTSPDAYIMGRTGMYGASARQYREMMREVVPGRTLPLMLTEANTSWRYHEGTDPRIRTQFGAAWLASSLGHFMQGGGDSFCYFTLTGGFGMIWLEKNQLKVYPAFYTLWLYRHFFSGNTVPVSNSEETVEGYGFRNERACGVLLVNKNNHSVETTLEPSGMAGRTPRDYVVNETTLPSFSRFAVEPVNAGEEEKGRRIFTMAPYEVRVVVWETPAR